MRWTFITLILGFALASLAHASEVRVGDPLPAVELYQWSGQPTALATLRSRVTVVDFWASWCVTCRAALPALDGIRQRHTEGLTILAINIDKSQANANRFLAEHLPKTAMTLLRDPDGAAMARFGAAGMPALYILDNRGVVRFAEAGYAPERLVTAEHVVVDLLRAAP